MNQHSVSKAIIIRINLIQIVFICKMLTVASKFLGHKPQVTLLKEIFGRILGNQIKGKAS